MQPDLSEELEALKHLSTGELCERYAQLYGQPVRTRHKAYLVRKVAWRLQARAEGDLSERARRRAAELADDVDVRLMPPRPKTTPLPPPPTTESAGARRVVRAPVKADPRLPAPGTALVRRYKGKTYRVVVRDDGLEYGVVADLSELARLARVTQPRMTQIMNLNHLAPDLQEELLFLAPVTSGRDTVTERMLRAVTSARGWREQRVLWRAVRQHLLR